jgi:hypothetical protein
MRFRHLDLNVGKSKIDFINKINNNQNNNENNQNKTDSNKDLSFSEMVHKIEGEKYNNDKNKINYSINKNSDILRYISMAIKNNLLYKTLISRVIIDKYDLYRMFTYYFLLLIFGCISGFAGLHILLLPIIIQNIIDIIW